MDQWIRIALWSFVSNDGMDGRMRRSEQLSIFSGTNDLCLPLTLFQRLPRSFLGSI